jgi:hypothetical protein
MYGGVKINLHTFLAPLYPRGEAAPLYSGHEAQPSPEPGWTWSHNLFSSSLQSRIFFPMDLRAKKPVPALFLKANSQFVLSLIILMKNDKLP